MALLSNKPDLEDVKDGLLGIDLSPFDPTALDAFLVRQLERSIGLVEDMATTYFDGIAVSEVRDGNGTNEIATRLLPVTSVSLVKVELPVLALTRSYTDQEIKLYPLQGRITIFTYKLGVEQASLHLDQQIYGNILPKLPNAVFLDYTAGFPRYDADLNVTSLDGNTDPGAHPKTVLAGDRRDPVIRNRLRQLQEAVVCHVAAQFCGRVAANPAGLLNSVSFDGFSKAFNPQAYAQAAQANKARFDEIMERRRRAFMVATG